MSLSARGRRRGANDYTLLRKVLGALQYQHQPVFQIPAKYNEIIERRVDRARAEVGGLAIGQVLTGYRTCGARMITSPTCPKQDAWDDFFTLDDAPAWVEANYPQLLKQEDPVVLIWWHSHGASKARPSVRDAANIDALCSSTLMNAWVVTLIVNKHGHKFARLDMNMPLNDFPIQVKLKVEVDYPSFLTDEEKKALDDEFDRNVTEHEGAYDEEEFARSKLLADAQRSDRVGAAARDHLTSLGVDWRTGQDIDDIDRRAASGAS